MSFHLAVSINKFPFVAKQRLIGIHQEKLKGETMKIFLITIFLSLIILSPSQAQIQTAVSKSIWSIVLPKTASKDIDMERVLLGEIKDSIIDEFVINTGSWRFRVDEIYFRGADASSFSLVSYQPIYFVNAKQSFPAEIRFIPSRTGVHQAEIVIITQADTLIQKIRGEGVQPRLDKVSKIIDFGQIYIGDKKDTLQAITIRNSGSSPLTITQTKHNKPNDNDFSTINGGGNFILEPNELHTMDLRFQPSSVGRTNGTLEFHYDGVGSPAVIHLFGEGVHSGKINATLQAGIASAKPRYRVEIPIYLIYEDSVKFSNATHIKTDLTYNNTILYPVNYSEIERNGNLSTITIDSMPLPPNEKNEIIKIKFTVALGITDESDLILSNYEAVGGKIEFEKIDGKFSLLGVCEEGGKRFVSTKSFAGLVSIQPNPALESFEIHYSFSERGFSEILLYNSFGQKVKTIFSGIVDEFGSLTDIVETNNLAQGNYFVIIKTPTVFESTSVMIVK